MSLSRAAAPYRRDDRPTLRVPVVIPLVEVTIDDTGNLAVTLDREPYCADGAWQRADLHRLLDQIAADLGTPLRVEVHEADGATFTDYVLPQGHSPQGHSPQPGAATTTAWASVFGISGGGFTAGEQVAVCVVVAQQIADEDGTAHLRLPPTLLAEHPAVVLVGRLSGAVAMSEGAA